MTRLFSAAAQLFRAQPWNVTVDERSVLSITAPELGVNDGVLAVMGQKGERVGFLVFSELDAFAKYLEGALEALEGRGDPSREPPRVGAHLLLDFSEGREVAPERRKEIAAERLEVASPSAYPSFASVDDDLMARAPDPREAAVLEAAARALAELVARGADVAALSGGSVSRTFDVMTAPGPVHVTLKYPHPALDLDQDASAALDDDIDTLALYEEFAASPEALALPELGDDEQDPAWPLVLLGYAEDHHDANVDRLTPAIVEHVLFELLPQHQRCAREDAEEIVRDLRAFFAFLARRGEHAFASECARALEGDAVDRLARALDQPR